MLPTFRRCIQNARNPLYKTLIAQENLKAVYRGVLNDCPGEYTLPILLQTRYSVPMQFLTLALALALSSLASAADYAPTTAAEIKKKLNAPCGVVHIWADWCQFCIEELPGFLKYFEQQKKAKVLVVDLSKKEGQEKFSKNFIAKIPSTFKTYHVTEEPSAFMKSLDANWHRSLPYTAFFFQGKRQLEWNGQLSIQDLEANIKKACPTEINLKKMRGK